MVAYADAVYVTCHSCCMLSTVHLSMYSASNAVGRASASTSASDASASNAVGRASVSTTT